MTRSELAKAIYDVSNLEGEFLLRSGQTSKEYFDKYLFESKPKILNEVGQMLSKCVPAGTDCLAALEMGGIPIGTMISHYCGLECLFIRKSPKEYGTRKYTEGGESKGKNLVIVEDVVTSGGAILEAVAKLRADGALVKEVLCVIDRESGGRERLLGNGLTLTSLFTKSELEKSNSGV